jgi:hypothetical protein
MTKGIEPNIALAGYDGGFVAKLRKQHSFLTSIFALIFCATFLPIGLPAQFSPDEQAGTLRIPIVIDSELPLATHKHEIIT